MGIVVPFEGYKPPPRFDSTPWTTVTIEEAPASGGPWTLIETIVLDPPDPNPADPMERSFSTDNATLSIGLGWYRVSFIDADDNVVRAEPILNTGPIEIMASLDDINGELPTEVVEATGNNTSLIQINVARLIRGYLRRVIDNGTLLTWTTPELTPETIRLIAAKLIAAQLYFQETAKTTTEISEKSFAQKKYDEAMSLINQIIAGTIDIPDITESPIEGLSDLDHFPRDATGRAFTRAMEL